MFDAIKVQQDTVKQLYKQFTGTAKSRACCTIDHNGDILLSPDGKRAYRIIRPLFFLDITALTKADSLLKHFNQAPGHTEVSPTYKTLKNGRERAFWEFEFDNGEKAYVPKAALGKLRPDENVTYYMDNKRAPLRVFHGAECIAVIMPYVER